MKTDEEIEKLIKDVVVACLLSAGCLCYGEEVILDEEIADKVIGIEEAKWN